MAQRHKFERNTDHRCPRCKRLNEDFNHVLQCQPAQAAGTLMWLKATGYFKERQTCPFVLQVLSVGIQLWLDKSAISWTTAIPKTEDTIGAMVYAAFHDQCTIGWDEIFRGRITRKWGQANALYCREHSQVALNDPRNCSWTAGLVTALWQYGRSRWTEYSRSRWTDRNEAIYGYSKEEQLEKETKENRRQNTGHACTQSGKSTRLRLSPIYHVLQQPPSTTVQPKTPVGGDCHDRIPSMEDCHP